MTCPRCHGRRTPCSLCGGYRIIVGPCASPGEQARQEIGWRIIGRPKWLDPPRDA